MTHRATVPSPWRFTAAAITFLVAAVALVALLWLLGGTPAAPVQAQAGTGTIRVATTGSDAPGCGSVGAPCRTVQYAVDQAQVGEAILVAAGVYTGVQARAGITQVVYISKTVTVRGGYTTTNWLTADPLANPTTLDAQSLGRALVITGTISTTVEGLRVTGGDATGLGGHPSGFDAGGGAYVYTATVTISGCMVYSNTATTSSRGVGGGLYFWYGDATLVRNTVRDNIASTTTGVSYYSGGYGGGLYLLYNDARLVRNTVRGNTASTGAHGCGGGLHLTYGTATLAGNTVRGNTASTADSGNGGGLYLFSTSATLQLNTIRDNTASTASYGSGGGVWLYTTFYPTDATLQGNTVVSNTASSAGSGQGGGLYLQCHHATLQGNTVQGNTAGAASHSHGGGVYLYYCPATLQGNTVQGNTANTGDAGFGGGLSLQSSDATLTGNTVISNTATLSPTATGQGGGLYVTYSRPFSLTNDLLVGNHATTGGSGLWAAGSSSSPTWGELRHTTIAGNLGSGQGVYVGPYTTLALTNTILVSHTVGISVTAGSTATLEATLWYGIGTEAGGAGTVLTGTVNVYGDPAFVGSGDYHLTDGSAAIDAGVDIGVPIDIDRDPRPRGFGCDIGADESETGGLPLYLPVVRKND